MFVDIFMSCTSFIKTMGDFEFNPFYVLSVSSFCRPALAFVNDNKTRACKLVRKCLDKETCEQLQNHFMLQEHEKLTRNDNCTLKLPRIKTEYARKSFMFMGAKVYNELPLELGNIENNKEIEKQLKEHFQ